MNCDHFRPQCDCDISCYECDVPIYNWSKEGSNGSNCCICGTILCTDHVINVPYFWINSVPKLVNYKDIPNVQGKKHICLSTCKICLIQHEYPC